MEENNNNTDKKVTSALSLTNSVLILGGTLFTIAAFFVSLSYRVTTVESTLRDFPLYRVENRLSSIEQNLGQLREEMRQREDKRDDNTTSKGRGR